MIKFTVLPLAKLVSWNKQYAVGWSKPGQGYAFVTNVNKSAKGDILINPVIEKALPDVMVKLMKNLKLWKK